VWQPWTAVRRRVFVYSPVLPRKPQLSGRSKLYAAADGCRAHRKGSANMGTGAGGCGRGGRGGRGGAAGGVPGEAEFAGGRSVRLQLQCAGRNATDSRTAEPAPPPLPVIGPDGPTGNVLYAWDPIAVRNVGAWRRRRWRLAGGALATAGNLIFSSVNDRLIAYKADTGEKLWKSISARRRWVLRFHSPSRANSTLPSPAAPGRRRWGRGAGAGGGGGGACKTCQPAGAVPRREPCRAQPTTSGWARRS
jgi:hypothetical protein